MVYQPFYQVYSKFMDCCGNLWACPSIICLQNYCGFNQNPLTFIGEIDKNLLQQSYSFLSQGAVL